MGVSTGMPPAEKIIHNYHDVTVELQNGNWRELGIDRWEKMGMAFKFQMGMGMKSLK